MSVDIDQARATWLDELLMRKRGYGIRYEILAPDPPIVVPVTQMTPCPACQRPMPVDDMDTLLGRCKRCKEANRARAGRMRNRTKKAQKAEAKRA